MTAPAAPAMPATSGARRWRTPAAVVGLVVVIAVVLATLSRTSAHGTLNPDSYDPDGSRAVVSVLRQQGVEVVPTTELAQSLDAISGPTGLVVVWPGLLNKAMTNQILRAGLTRITLVNPTESDPAMIRLAAGITGSPRLDEETSPDCTEAYATAAGTAALGEATGYDARGWAGRATTCYGTPDSAAIVDIEAYGDRPAVTLLGSPEILQNSRITDEGNAALALNLIGREGRVIWWVPSSTDPALTAAASPLGDLIPGWFAPLLLQIAFGVLLLVGWRIRRMGRVVTEQLPVVVRGSETAEGRARLLHGSDARDLAADFTRGWAVQQLASRLGVAPGAEQELVARVAETTGRPADQVREILFGTRPTTDLALVDLVEELRKITETSP